MLQRYHISAVEAEAKLQSFMTVLDLSADDLPVFRFWSVAFKRRRDTD